MIRRISTLCLSCSMLLSPLTDADPMMKDPHRISVGGGFFDIHICNWPDRPPFYLALFGSNESDAIRSIEVITDQGTSLGLMNLKKFRSAKMKNGKERRVFLTQFDIPMDASDGWYRARIELNDGSRHEAEDFIIHSVMQRPQAMAPAHESEEIPMPKKLTWDKVPGATHYKLFIKDMWAGEKEIHASKLFTDNSYQLPDGLLEPGGYYAWKLHARDSNEHVLLGDFNHGSLSAWTEFSIAE